MRIKRIVIDEENKWTKEKLVNKIDDFWNVYDLREGILSYGWIDEWSKPNKPVYLIVDDIEDLFKFRILQYHEELTMVDLHGKTKYFTIRCNEKPIDIKRQWEEN